MNVKQGFDEICPYVSKKVPEVTGQNQNPVMKGEIEGQLILGRGQGPLPMHRQTT